MNELNYIENISYIDKKNLLKSSCEIYKKINIKSHPKEEECKPVVNCCWFEVAISLLDFEQKTILIHDFIDVDNDKE